MPQALNISRNRHAQALAQAEFIRLEQMLNQAMWDDAIPEEHKPIVLSYLERKKEEASALAVAGVIEKQQNYGRTK